MADREPSKARMIFSVVVVGLGALVLLIFVGSLIFGRDDQAAPTTDAPPAGQPTEANLDQLRVQRVKTTISAALRDPSSARFGEVWVSRKGGEPVVCGSVSAKNGLGGYTGQEQFMATDDAVSKPTGRPTAEFAEAWNRICAG